MLHGAALAEQERFAVVDHAAVDADPTDLAGEPSIFDLGAAVHHHLQSGVFGHLRRLVVANPELHPHHLCTDGNGLAHSLRRGVGGAEHVDDIDRLLDIGKRSVDLLSEKLFAGVSGIDRNDSVAFRHEIFHREIAWPRLRRARPYEGKGAAAPENASDIGVAIAVVVHASRRAVMLANGSGMTAVPPQRRHGAKNRYFWSSAPPGDAGAEGGVSEEGAESAGFVSADRKSTRLNSSHLGISYAVFCLKKKKQTTQADQGLYARAMQQAICPTPKLALIEAEADSHLIRGERIAGLKLENGRALNAVVRV